MPDEHFYLGIDLGTTNSSIHWGALNPNTKLIEPHSLAFDQRVSDGSIQRRALLPSFVYFKQGEPHPIVGEYARSLGLQAQPSRVARSVKSYMGREDWRFEADGRSYTAAQLSSYILQTLFAGIKNTWDRLVTDVVITVPASFDGDMRADTLEAARLAGFKTTEKNGETRNLLLDEPRAALFDLLNQQASGSIPAAVIDLSTAKTVLVFDLGGGTLDVSLHSVSLKSDGTDMSVDDLAISRYTQLGGDVFDRLVADELQRRFEARLKRSLEEMDPTDRYLVRFKLEVQAEQAKQRLTTDIQQRLSQGAESIPDSFAVDIHMPFLFDNQSLFTQLSKKEFEDLIAPLLGHHLSMNDLPTFDSLDYSKADNIIYPILDVLSKAEKQMEGRVPKVDAVVLNGGMTRVHAVRSRLETFFGLRPLTVLDPEMSVSRGASIHHYRLHRGFRPRAILAESIGVEVHGEHVQHLIPAGTVLPTQQVFDGFFEVPFENATVIRLPLYRGEGKTPGPPNKKILERRLVLSKPQRAGAPLHVEISIDVNKLVRFVASLTNSPGDQVIVEVGAEASEADATLVRPLAVQPYRPPNPPYPPEQARLEIRKASGTWDVGRFRDLQPWIVDAANGQQLIEILLQELPGLNRIGRARVLQMLGELGVRYPRHPKIADIIQACLQNMSGKALESTASISTATRSAVVALGKIGSSTMESSLINLLGLPDVDAIRGDILFSLGKCGASRNVLEHVHAYFDSERKGDRIASLWAIGRLGSREKNPVIPIADLLELIPHVCCKTDARFESHAVARKYAVYALGEIGDRRTVLPHREVIDQEHADMIVASLQQAKKRVLNARDQEEIQTRRFADLALRMVKGEVLSVADAGTLMAVRTLMALGGH